MLPKSKTIFFFIALILSIIGCKQSQLLTKYYCGIVNLKLDKSTKRYFSYDQGHFSIIGFSEGTYDVRKDTLFLNSYPIDSFVKVQVEKNITSKNNTLVVKLNEKNSSGLIFFNKRQKQVSDGDSIVIDELDNINLSLKIPFPYPNIGGYCHKVVDTLQSINFLKIVASKEYKIKVVLDINFNYFNYKGVNDTFRIVGKSLFNMKNQKVKFIQTNFVKDLIANSYFNYCKMP